MSELARQVAARYLEINGRHPMTPADDAYVSRHFVTLEELCVGRGRGNIPPAGMVPIQVGRP
jgi:hypothetical protein